MAGIKLSLNKHWQVNTFMGKIIRQVYTGELEPEKGRTLSYMCSVLLKGLETAEIEGRLQKLETQAEEGYQTGLRRVK